MKLVSVIAPMYNGEKYIRDFIEQVRNQSYSNIELIIVDNGSKDKSLEIAKSMSEVNLKILIEDQKQGPSAARNKGLAVANGEYIVFLDIDDKIDFNMIQALVSHLDKNVDMVACRYEEVTERNETTFVLNPYSHPIEKIEHVRRNFEKMAYGEGYLWNKAFKSQIIRDNHIRFREDIRVCEDQVFIAEYLNHCNGSVAYINDVLYRYVKHPNSIMNAYVPEIRITEIRAIEYLIENQCDANRVFELRKRLGLKVIEYICTVMSLYGKAEIQKSYILEFKNLRNRHKKSLYSLLSHGISMENRVKGFMLAVMPLPVFINVYYATKGRVE